MVAKGKQDSHLTPYLSFSLVTCPNQSKRAESDVEHCCHLLQNPSLTPSEGWEEDAARSHLALTNSKPQRLSTSRTAELGFTSPQVSLTTLSVEQGSLLNLYFWQ